MTDLRTIQAADGAQIQVSLYGGHLCAWRTARGVERLYLSPRADLSGTGAISGASSGTTRGPIRGGVPVVFPQFASDGPLPKHGFAREAVWQIVPSSARADGLEVLTLELSDNAATHALFAHAFKLTFEIVFGGESLDMRFAVHNPGQQPFAFNAALHTYLAAHRASACVHGLEQCAFTDSAAAGRVVAAQGQPVQFDTEVDRRYHGAPALLELRDAQGAVRISQTGFADTVVWNPGAVLSQKIPDLPDDGFEHFVCVEAAAVKAPLQLAAGAAWVGSQRLEVMPL